MANEKNPEDVDLNENSVPIINAGEERPEEPVQNTFEETIRGTFRHFDALYLLSDAMRFYVTEARRLLGQRLSENSIQNVNVEYTPKEPLQNLPEEQEVLRFAHIINRLSRIMRLFHIQLNAAIDRLRMAQQLLNADTIDVVDVEERSEEPPEVVAVEVNVDLIENPMDISSAVEEGPEESVHKNPLEEAMRRPVGNFRALISETDGQEFLAPEVREIAGQRLNENPTLIADTGEERPEEPVRNDLGRRDTRAFHLLSRLCLMLERIGRNIHEAMALLQRSEHCFTTDYIRIVNAEEATQEYPEVVPGKAEMNVDLNDNPTQIINKTKESPEEQVRNLIEEVVSAHQVHTSQLHVSEVATLSRDDNQGDEPDVASSSVQAQSGAADPIEVSDTFNETLHCESNSSSNVMLEQSARNPNDYSSQCCEGNVNITDVNARALTNYEADRLCGSSQPEVLLKSISITESGKSGEDVNCIISESAALSQLTIDGVKLPESAGSHIAPISAEHQSEDAVDGAYTSDCVLSVSESSTGSNRNESLDTNPEFQNDKDNASCSNSTSSLKRSSSQQES